jgi:hypothetical protein
VESGYGTGSHRTSTTAGHAEQDCGSEQYASSHTPKTGRTTPALPQCRYTLITLINVERMNGVVH